MTIEFQLGDRVEFDIYGRGFSTGVIVPHANRWFGYQSIVSIKRDDGITDNGEPWRVDKRNVRLIAARNGEYRRPHWAKNKVISKCLP